MRYILTLLCCCLFSALLAQTPDITPYSQNKALIDSSVVATDSAVFPASYPEISEVYQIPAYNLYQQHWDVKHLRSKELKIPFSDGRIMMILVQASNNPFAVPCVYEDVSQAFGLLPNGAFHPGVDLKVAPQTLVKSCFDGVVRMGRYYGDYGWTVVIRHYNGLETVYAHLDKLCVKPGQVVNVGDVIGQAGRSGNVKDCTLHFETRFMNAYFDPAMMIDFENETLIKNTLVLTEDDFHIVPIEETSPAPTHNGKKPGKTTRVDNPSAPVSPATSGDGEFHVVQKGENLYRISVKYKTTVDRLLQLNNLPNADHIVEGQRLRVR